MFDDAGIAEGGLIGSGSIEALRSLMTKRGTDESIEVLLKSLNCLQGYHYLSICEKYSKNKKFVYGWFKNRVS